MNQLKVFIAKSDGCQSKIFKENLKLIAEMSKRLCDLTQLRSQTDVTETEFQQQSQDFAG